MTYRINMQPPKRIRLLYSRLYDRVKVNLATDKEIKQLRYFQARIEQGFINLTKPRKKHVRCSANCGFTDTFKTDEFGLNYFQAVGTCPACNAPTVYKDGKPTLIEVTFIMTPHN